MQGTLLYPLNQLESLLPEVYAGERAKYGGREKALDFRIPYVDLLWNDVLHTAAVHPYYLFRALRAADMDHTQRRGSEYSYRIPVEALRERRCVYYRTDSFCVNNAPHEKLASTP